MQEHVRSQEPRICKGEAAHVAAEVDPVAAEPNVLLLTAPALALQVI